MVLCTAQPAAYPCYAAAMTPNGSFQDENEAIGEGNPSPASLSSASTVSPIPYFHSPPFPQAHLPPPPPPPPYYHAIPYSGGVFIPPASSHHLATHQSPVYSLSMSSMTPPTSPIIHSSQMFMPPMAPLPPPPPPPTHQFRVPIIPPPISVGLGYSATGSAQLTIQPAPWKQNYGMEKVWQSEFQRLFTILLPHLWTIVPVRRRPVTHTGTLHTFVDSAKVRFCCEECGHGWTSMKGRVAFWFDMFPPHSFPFLAFPLNGVVTFKLYGQSCDRCGAAAAKNGGCQKMLRTSTEETEFSSGRFESPMWYPEEVAKVMTNLYNRIGQIYYGFQSPPIERARRAGKPRLPHNASLCQACFDGVCSAQLQSGGSNGHVRKTHASGDGSCGTESKMARVEVTTPVDVEGPAEREVDYETDRTQSSQD